MRSRAFLVDPGVDEVDDVIKYYLTGADASTSRTLAAIDAEVGTLRFLSSIKTRHNRENVLYTVYIAQDISRLLSVFFR